MGIFNLQKVAGDVSETIRHGQLVDMGDIIRANGYAHSTSLRPTQITRSKTFQKAMKPLAEQLKNEIDRLALELTKRDLSEEKYETMAKSLDVLNKNFQLVTGGATERSVLVLPSELIDKNGIRTSSSTETDSK